MDRYCHGVQKLLLLFPFCMSKLRQRVGKCLSQHYIHYRLHMFLSIRPLVNTFTSFLSRSEWDCPYLWPNSRHGTEAWTQRVPSCGSIHLAKMMRSGMDTGHKLCQWKLFPARERDHFFFLWGKCKPGIIGGHFFPFCSGIS